MTGLLISERVSGHLCQTFAAGECWAVVIDELPRMTVHFVSEPPTRYELELFCEIHVGMWASRECRN